MDQSQRFRINKPTVVHENIAGEVVIIEFNSGNYYSLDNAGVPIWQFLENGATPGEIIEKIAHLYGSSPVEIEMAVCQFIDELQKENLIVSDKSKKPESIQKPLGAEKTSLKTEKPGFEAPILQKYTDMQELLLLDPIHEVDERGWPSKKRS